MWVYKCYAITKLKWKWSCHKETKQTRCSKERNSFFPDKFFFFFHLLTIAISLHLVKAESKQKDIIKSKNNNRKNNLCWFSCFFLSCISLLLICFCLDFFVLFCDVRFRRIKIIDKSNNFKPKFKLNCIKFF